MFKIKTINGGNYYNQPAFEKICEGLEKGDTVQVYIDCIGHTRNNDEQEAYKEALTEKYGDTLNVEKNEGGYSYSYSYQISHN